jgi:hypothetical protein
MVSIVMNACNEGGRVRATVEAMRSAFGEPCEVIVVDDASTDGSCDDLPEGTIVLRNAERIGCGRSKARAQSVARGDVLFFCDAHFAHIEGELRSAVDDAVRGEVIIACALRGIEYDAQWVARVVDGGMLMVPDARGIGVGVHALKKYPAEGDREPYADLMVGGANVLVSRRTLFERLGGWNRYRGKYGSQERGMAMRAFMAAVPIRVRPDIVLGHEFNRTSSASRPRWPYRPASMLDVAMATWHAYGAVVTAPTFRSAIVPLLMDHPQYRLAHGFETDPWLAEDRELFARNCKRRPDAELLPLLAPKCVPADKGGATLGDDALMWIRQYARGRALEFGTGSGRGTETLMDACTEVVSIDESEKFTHEARTRFVSCRAEFFTAPKRPAGGYELAGAVTGRFDTLLLDGPAGPAARREALASAWDLLAPGCVILVDDGKRDRALVEGWMAKYPELRGELLPTGRGLWVLRKEGE